MRKQLISVMLCLAALGGLMTYPMPVSASVLQSQTIKTQGQVVDEQGEPLIGVNVMVKGSRTGAVTDLDGKFQLEVPANATLVISYVGYKSREVAVRSRAILDAVQLSPDNHVLDQVVVVGYGTQKKADLTGSVSIVNAEDLKKVSNSNISTMLEGKVPGVQITTDGQPGAEATSYISYVSMFKCWVMNMSRTSPPLNDISRTMRSMSHSCENLSGILDSAICLSSFMWAYAEHSPNHFKIIMFLTA